MKNALFIFFLFAFLSAQAQSERKIPNDSLPASVKANMADKFKGYKIANVSVGAENGAEVYKVEARKIVNENKTLIFNLVYDMNGKLLSKKKDKEIYYSDPPEKEKKSKEENTNNPFPRY